MHARIAHTDYGNARLDFPYFQLLLPPIVISLLV